MDRGDQPMASESITRMFSIALGKRATGRLVTWATMATLGQSDGAEIEVDPHTIRSPSRTAGGRGDPCLRRARNGSERIASELSDGLRSLRSHGIYRISRFEFATCSFQQGNGQPIATRFVIQTALAAFCLRVCGTEVKVN